MAKKIYAPEKTGQSFFLPGQTTARDVSCSACGQVIYVQVKSYGHWGATAYSMDESRYCQLCGAEFDEKD